MQTTPTESIPVLTNLMTDSLTQISKSRTFSSGLVKRSKIILLATQGNTTSKIATKLHLSKTTVSLWKKRFLVNLPRLREIEISVPDQLATEIEKLLSDKQRPGAPSTFTPEQITKIIDLACKNPKDLGYEVSQWSLSLLVTEIINSGIADQISKKSVSRFLKERGITPA